MNVEKIKGLLKGFEFMLSVELDKYEKSVEGNKIFFQDLEKTSGNTISKGWWESILTQDIYGIESLLGINFLQKDWLFKNWGNIIPTQEEGLNRLRYIIGKGFPENLQDYLDGKLSIEEIKNELC